MPRQRRGRRQPRQVRPSHHSQSTNVTWRPTPMRPLIIDREAKMKDLKDSIVWQDIRRGERIPVLIVQKYTG